MALCCGHICIAAGNEKMLWTSKILVPISYRFGQPWWVPLLGQCTSQYALLRNNVSQFEQDAPTSSTMTLEALTYNKISLACSKYAKLYLQILLAT